MAIEQTENLKEQEKTKNNQREFFDHVFLADYCEILYPDYDEIEELEWIDLYELENELMCNPKRFTAWFIIAAPQVLRMINVNFAPAAPIALGNSPTTKKPL